MPVTTVDQHELESGVSLQDVPVAYESWGTLNDDGTNALLVCHALTGNADAADWWGALVGPGRALDTDRYFVLCLNIPGSPYGSVSPLTPNPSTGARYGADFPAFTLRDTVRLHRRVLWGLGVRQIASVIGGSMGGMLALEWGFHADVVRSIVPIAVGGRHSPWQIGWSEAQRQAIYADPHWNDGRYTDDAPPDRGLAAARMMAMVSYRSRASFERRFGRQVQSDNGTPEAGAPFAVESYLRHQGTKLVGRFDANCYVALTKQMDTHDVARGRGDYPGVLATVEPPALVVGIDTDVLYPLEEQRELAATLPNADLAVLESPHGHDAFLIEFDQLADAIGPWLDTHAAADAAVG